MNFKFKIGETIKVIANIEGGNRGTHAIPINSVLKIVDRRFHSEICLNYYILDCNRIREASVVYEDEIELYKPEKINLL